MKNLKKRTIMGRIAGAAIGAAGDVASAGMQTAASIVNTNNTNKTNLQIAQDTNKANYEIAQMSNEYNQQMLERQIEQEWDMWNAENEYNSIGAQMQRAEDAGLNPYQAIGGAVTSGTASSMHSPSAQPAVVPQIQGATMQPADMSGLSGLRGIASDFIGMLKAQEDVKGQQLANEGQDIENQYKADMFMVEMYKKMKEAGLADSQRVGQDIMNKFKPELLQSEIRQRNTDAMFTKIRADGQMLANLSALEWYKVLPEQIRMTLNEQAIRINNMKLQGKLTAAQVRTEVNKAVTEFYKSRVAHDEAAFTNGTLKARMNQVAADLSNAILSSGGDNLQSFFTRRWSGSQLNKEGIPKEFSIDYWK